MTATTERALRTYRGAYDLTEEQELFRRTLREFGEREIVPIAHELDEKEEYPRATISKMAELGLLGLLVPEEYGGAGATTLDYALAIEEISWADAAHSVVISVNNSLVCEPILHFGTDEQKQRFLPALAGGTYVGAYCLTEPGSGSDASNMSTAARRDGDSYVLNGSKSWITNGGEAGLYLVYAVTNMDVPRAKGITAFLIPAETPGLRAGARRKRSSVSAPRAPPRSFLKTAACRCGRAGKGRRGLSHRHGHAGWRADRHRRAGARHRPAGARRVGAVRKEREAFGHPIADFQGLQWRMADMATRIEAARLLVYRAARMKDAGQSFAKEASMAKLFASETAMFCAHAAVQTFGGNGFSRDYPVEKLFRDAKITEIYEGTSEIQRLVISRHVLR